MRGRTRWQKALFACVLAIPHVLACMPSGSSGPEPDTDHDGLSDREELQVYGTSPLMPDTDGDGYTDYQEVVTYGFDPGNDPDRFNPRVADLPMMTIVFTGPPVVRFVATLTDGTTVTVDNSVADSVTYGDMNSVDQHQGQSNTQSVSQTVTNDMSVSPSTMSQTSVTVPLSSGSDAGAGPDADASVGGDGDDGGDGRGNEDAEIPDSRGAQDVSEAFAGAQQSSSPSGATLTQTEGNSTTLTFDNSVSTTVNPSTTIDTAIDFTQAQMRQNQRTLTQDQSLATSHQVATIATSLRVPTMIENRSHVGFRCTNVFLGAVLVEFSGAMLALTNLELDQDIITSFQPFALAPGETTGPANFVSPPLELSSAFDILSSGRALILNLATYELDDSTGKSYAFATTDIGSKTALVAIDYGKGSSRQPELYQVATNFDPSHASVPASQIFQNILHVPYFAAPQTGLVAVRNFAVTSSGGPHWSVALVHDSGPDIETTSYGDGADPYDFDGIQVRAGDVLHLAYVRKGASAASDAGVSPPPLGVGPPPDAGGRPVEERPPDARAP